MDQTGAWRGSDWPVWEQDWGLWCVSGSRLVRLSSLTRGESKPVWADVTCSTYDGCGMVANEPLARLNVGKMWLKARLHERDARFVIGSPATRRVEAAS